MVSFEIDGREVSAPEGAMLVDGAKLGDVEIPYFCYEPKLGDPVGACRMCLVEIEGIPKLQTACSTAVKDGMVVTTTSDRVKEAQSAVVEFLLINHPLDCPVCDKGGECPLQDITFGWGPGRSRYVEPKRHFKKPLELSPLVAIDRERCILCYRCVRFSQEIAEDSQLAFLERGDHTFVGTHDGHPYVAPFSGNIIELCPVGALTSTAYRFRARPWEIEGAGSVCTLCPSQCNIEFTVRDDDKVLRVLARFEGHGNTEVDDGWLCDRGRFGYQAIHSPERVTTPLLNEGGTLRAVSWERALEAAAAGLGRSGAATAALAGGETTNEEGFLLQRLLRETLGSPHVAARTGASLDAQQARALAAPELSPRVSDIDYAGCVLVIDSELVDESPILDLRVRKAARRNGVKVVVLTSRPSSLDPNADAVVRFAPGAAEAALRALAAAVGEPRGGGEGLDDLALRAGAGAEGLRSAAALLRRAEPVVALWGERVSDGERGREAVAALLALTDALGLAGAEGGGLIEVPRGTNARGLREVGCAPNLLPGMAAAEGEQVGAGAPEIAAALAGGDLSGLLLVGADPLRTHPDRGAWERALDAAGFVVAVSDFVTESVAEHADVVLPGESYAETEGTVTHPDGRLQRVRAAIGHPGEVRAIWSVLAELAARVDDSEPAAATIVEAFEQMVAAVPFYAGATLAEIGGGGVRWQDRDAASALPAAETADAAEDEDGAPPERTDGLRLGTAPSLWATREGDHAPALRFLAPAQRAELSPADAERLGIAAGDEVEVASNGTSVRAVAALRSAMPAGSVFLIEGTERENATALTNGAPRTVEVRKQ